MPVLSHSYAHFQAAAGNPPAAPSAVTSITKDAGATISFLPGAQGDAPVSSWQVTPYITGTAQSPVTVGTGSAATITGSDANVYTQVPVTGLANGTAYTFTVRGVSAAGTGTESSQSGENTPLSGLVFGDDFGGPAGGPIDPEWWVYTRCGYLSQSEVQYYLPSQVSIDGNSCLLLTATKTSYTGPKYASAGGGSITQPWRSGAVQNNTRTFVPAAGNTMTFEARQQPCPDIGGGMWPGLFWLQGQNMLNNWKTDPQQTGWDNGGNAEIDVAEWHSGMIFDPSDYLTNVFIGNTGGEQYTPTISTSTDFSAALHTFAARWKPGANVTFLRDGAQTGTTSVAASSSCHYFMMLYLQILSGSATATQSCVIDWVRVYDQNLG